ncbi:MAG TPA: MbcA/ParS/Xre antitoxin family protein [Burkholderiales bacterium]|nr:MbcA/ParS/Xre antitoxin family protein [Burkholderiales bacterium]
MSTFISQSLFHELRCEHERVAQLETIARSLTWTAEQQELVAMAIELFGSEAGAAQWLLCQPPIMGGRTPLELLSDADGQAKVRHSLNCLTYGLPA